MRARTLYSMMAIATPLITAVAWTAEASAESQQLDCLLTDTGAQTGNRSIVIIFDDDAKTLTAQAGNQSYRFNNVSITYVSMSGDVDGVTVGLDRSSLGIVWQQYGAEGVVTEFGQCRPTDHPAAADTH